MIKKKRNNYWWQEASIYQVYPRSFQDSNGDGIGDIQGIISRLDYIKEMGFDAIWLSPHYKSPQRDFGYDISDYRSIAPEYGTMKHCIELIKEVHKRDMKIIFDMILNHTSDEHPWFIESRTAISSPKRDWYIWQNGKAKSPPNNWKSLIGGSGWIKDKNTNQYYYHSFLPFQPDLNFRNPEVKQEMFETMKFWLDKGVDGFRLDIFHTVYKDSLFRNNPFYWRYIPTGELDTGFFQKLKYTIHQPETFELAKEIRTMLEKADKNKCAIGEVFGKLMIKKYLGENQDGLNLILKFDFMEIKKVTASSIKKIIKNYEKDYDSPLVPTYSLGNHDRRRLMTRLGENEKLNKLMAMLQYTARGTSITYYGDEVGIPDGDFPHKNAKDSVAKQYWWFPKGVAQFLGFYMNRDGCRTPMQWDSSPNAGFCSENVQSWLPIHKSYRRCNVEIQSKNQYSILNTHKKLLHLKKDKQTLRYGSMKILDLHKNIVAYERTHEEEKVKVIMNFSKKEIILENTHTNGKIIFKTDEFCKIDKGRLFIPAYGGVLLE